MKKIVVSLISLLLVACSSNTNSSTETNIQPSTKSRTNASSESMDIPNWTWDFSTQRALVYSFSQKMEIENTAGKDRPMNEMITEGLGKIKIQVKENNEADIRFEDMVMKVIQLDETGVARDTIENPIPPSVLSGYSNQGTFDEPNANAYFSYILPLPSRDLAINERDSIILNQSFGTKDFMLKAEGVNALVFERMETIDNRYCAVLKGIIDIDIQDTPQDASGEYIFSTKGEGTYYFDVENRIYYGSDISLIKETKMVTGDTPEKKGIFMHNKSKEVYSIRLLDIEENTESEE